jgi:hypothetical protein
LRGFFFADAAAASEEEAAGEAADGAAIATVSAAIAAMVSDRERVLRSMGILDIDGGASPLIGATGPTLEPRPQKLAFINRS